MFLDIQFYYKQYPKKPLQNIRWGRFIWQNYPMIILMDDQFIIASGFISDECDVQIVTQSLMRQLKVKDTFFDTDIQNTLYDQSKDSSIQIVLYGTPFQHRVWQTLTQIPCGQTLSYQQVAQQIECSSAVRAVGRAIGQNPVSGFLPCHRVIASNGCLQGFRWGLTIKKMLLESEIKRC